MKTKKHGSSIPKGKYGNVSIGRVGRIHNGNATTYNVTNHTTYEGCGALVHELPELVRRCKDDGALRALMISVLNQLLDIDARSAPSAPVPQSVPEKAVCRNTPREIIDYVCKVRCYLAEEWRSRFDKVWEELLSRKTISEAIYRVGKQQGTNFNRNLVANILYYMDRHGVYGRRYNAASMALALEGDKDSSIRAALRKEPSEDIMTSLDRYFAELKKGCQKPFINEIDSIH